MKKTTYMMIGAYVTGLLLIIGYVSLVLAGSGVLIDEEFGGETVVAPLEDFDTISLSGVKLHGERLSVYGLKGIKVSVSDSVTSPSIAMPSDMQSMVSYEVKNGKLDVDINVDRFAAADSLRRNVVTIRDYCPVEVVIPAGMLAAVENPDGATIYVDDLKAGKLRVKSEGRVVFTDCLIDTVIGSGNDFRELKLDDARIGFAEIVAPSTFSVTTKNDSSYIETLQLKKP